MRLLDYFAGPLFDLWSPFSPEECARRVNAAAGFAFDPRRSGVIGLIWFDRVRLRYRGSPFEFGTKPVLAGRIDPMLGGTRLRLRYRAPMPAYFAAALAVPMLLLMIWFAMLASNSLGVSSDDPVPILMAAFVFIVLPFVMHRIGSRNSEAELDALLRFLAQQVQARRLAEGFRPEFPR
jgi:hypothetical protein